VYGSTGIENQGHKTKSRTTFRVRVRQDTTMLGPAIIDQLSACPAVDQLSALSLTQLHNSRPKTATGKRQQMNYIRSVALLTKCLCYVPKQTPVHRVEVRWCRPRSRQPMNAVGGGGRPTNLAHKQHLLHSTHYRGGSVAEWLACWTQAQKGPGSNCSRDTVG